MSALEPVTIKNLRIAKPLYDLVESEIAPGTDLDPDTVWASFGAIVEDLGPKNRRLLEVRARLEKDQPRRAAKPLQPPGGAGSFVTDNFADSQFPILIGGPSVKGKTTSTLTLAWDTDELADSFVRFGTGEELGLEVGVAQVVLDHQITLTNLEPGQKYF